MARGRKKLEIRDFRIEKIRAVEAAKLLKIQERDFYRLVERGFIPKSQGGFYELGAVIDGFLNFSQSQNKITDIKKIYLNFDEAAHVLGISKSSLYRLVNEGFIPVSYGAGGYRLADLIKGFVDSVTSIEDLTRERIRLTNARTEILKREISKKYGDLFSADIFIEIYDEIKMNVKTLLSAIPSKAASLLSATPPPPQFMFDYVKTFIDEAISELYYYTGEKIKEEIYFRQVRQENKRKTKNLTRSEILDKWRIRISNKAKRKKLKID